VMTHRRTSAAPPAPCDWQLPRPSAFDSHDFSPSGSTDTPTSQSDRCWHR